jgi:hypothetical protein
MPTQRFNVHENIKTTNPTRNEYLYIFRIYFRAIYNTTTLVNHIV